MKKNLLAALVAATIISPAVIAEAPSYSFVEGGYSNGSIGSADLTGLYLKGSAELNDNFFIMADYAPLEIDFSGMKADLDASGFGFGYKDDYSATASWFVSYNLGNWDLDGTDIDVDTLRVGIRNQINSDFELNGSIASVDFDGDSEIGFQFGMAYNTSKTLQFIASYESVDDLDSLNLGLRVNF